MLLFVFFLYIYILIKYKCYMFYFILYLCVYVLLNFYINHVILVHQVKLNENIQNVLIYLTTGLKN